MKIFVCWQQKKKIVIFRITLSHESYKSWASKAQCLCKMSPKFILPFLYLQATSLPTTLPTHWPNISDSQQWAWPHLMTTCLWENTSLYHVHTKHLQTFTDMHIFQIHSHLLHILEINDLFLLNMLTWIFKLLIFMRCSN